MSGQLLVSIEAARERVAHFEEIKNESSGRKKLKSWRRKLNKLLREAELGNMKVPPNQHDPEEVAQAALAEAKKRVRAPFQVQAGFTGWAPWGDNRWSAVVVEDPGRIWSRVLRVDPKTNAARVGLAEAPAGKVRRERLIYRDPEKAGADRPPGVPTDYWAPAPEEADEPEPVAERPTMQEDQPKHRISVEELHLLFDELCLKHGLDTSVTTNDW